MVADQEFVALDDLAAAFQLTVREESLGAITVTYKGKTIVLTPDQALASVAGRLVSLPAPPSRSGRRWLVPVEFISRALALVYDARLDLRKPSRLLVVGDLRVPRIIVRYDPLGARGRLTIDATPRAHSTVTQESGTDLSIKFDADALDAPIAAAAAADAAGRRSVRARRPRRRRDDDRRSISVRASAASGPPSQPVGHHGAAGHRSASAAQTDTHASAAGRRPPPQPPPGRCRRR